MLGIACALLCSSSCRTANNPCGRWTYGISREAYAPDAHWFHVTHISHAGDLVLIPVIYGTPFVIDTVLLPIAVARDVMYP